MPGAPVTASMSDDGTHRNQGGTVEYNKYPTPDLFRGGIFYSAPNLEGG